MAIGLVLADDHPIFLDGLESLFRKESDLSVLARCVNAAETLKAVRQHRPDVLILGLQMPGMGNLAILRQMKSEQLSTRVVLLTSALNEDDLLEAIRLGVAGVVLKGMAPSLFVLCVRKVHAGEQWLEKLSFSRALEKLLQREAGVREVAGILTQREIEIVHMVAAGLRNKEIAEKLFISEGTVKTHLRHIFGKVQVSSRQELARCAQDKRLIIPPSDPQESRRPHPRG
jgi:DNA-binding NarL/FixJ family response regulator